MAPVASSTSSGPGGSGSSTVSKTIADARPSGETPSVTGALRQRVARRADEVRELVEMLVQAAEAGAVHVPVGMLERQPEVEGRAEQTLQQHAGTPLFAVDDHAPTVPPPRQAS